ncbi:MAG: hypothetical protein HY326_10500 [Chloroflexi bacterium]|nr:hypothetical protein [Chloroflexota bacterium]
MDPAGDRHVVSFLIRFWLEPRELEHEDPPLRGYIRHLQTGEEDYLSSPEMLVEYVRRQLERISDAEQQTPPA